MTRHRDYDDDQAEAEAQTTAEAFPLQPEGDSWLGALCGRPAPEAKGRFGAALHAVLCVNLPCPAPCAVCALEFEPREQVAEGGAMDPEQWADIINACLERGFVLPLHVCAVSVNGAVLVVRSSASEEDEASIDGEVVVQHCPAAGAQWPINIMIADADSAAARVLLVQPDTWQFADLN